MSALSMTNGTLTGIITDGDLRRHMRPDLTELRADDVMTKRPITVTADQLASEVLEILNSSKITALFVVDGRQAGRHCASARPAALRRGVALRVPHNDGLLVHPCRTDVQHHAIDTLHRDLLPAGRSEPCNAPYRYRRREWCRRRPRSAPPAQTAARATHRRGG